MPLPAVLAAIGIAGSAGAGIAQAISGGRLAREAQAALDSYQRQDLTNLAESLPLRTDAQRFQAQQQDASLASVLNVLQQGGNFTAATSIANQSLQAKQSIAATIQGQQDKLDQLKLDEEIKIRGLRETREQNDLAGLGAQLQFGNQQRAQGISAIGNAFGTLANAASGGLFGGGGAGGANTRALQSGYQNIFRKTATLPNSGAEVFLPKRNGGFNFAYTNQYDNNNVA